MPVLWRKYLSGDKTGSSNETPREEKERQRLKVRSQMIDAVPALQIDFCFSPLDKLSNALLEWISHKRKASQQSVVKICIDDTCSITNHPGT